MNLTSCCLVPGEDAESITSERLEVREREMQDQSRLQTDENIVSESIETTDKAQQSNEEDVADSTEADNSQITVAAGVEATGESSTGLTSEVIYESAVNRSKDSGESKSEKDENLNKIEETRSENSDNWANFQSVSPSADESALSNSVDLNSSGVNIESSDENKRDESLQAVSKNVDGDIEHGVNGTNEGNSDAPAEELSEDSSISKEEKQKTDEGEKQEKDNKEHKSKYSPMIHFCVF